MDFKSPIRLPSGVCNPLTVLDDHSRYALGLQACADQTGPTVQTQLTHLFTTYGLPYAFLVDNGSPWCGQHPASLSTVSVWLIQLGIEVYHARPYHPQTLGKDERFHRTLQAELLASAAFRDLAHTQQRLCALAAGLQHPTPARSPRHGRARRPLLRQQPTLYQCQPTD